MQDDRGPFVPAHWDCTVRRLLTRFNVSLFGRQNLLLTSSITKSCRKQQELRCKIPKKKVSFSKMLCGIRSRQGWQPINTRGGWWGCSWRTWKRYVTVLSANTTLQAEPSPWRNRWATVPTHFSKEKSLCLQVKSVLHYSWTLLCWTLWSRTPCYLEQNRIPLGFALTLFHQSFTTHEFSNSVISNIQILLVSPTVSCSPELI